MTESRKWEYCESAHPLFARLGATVKIGGSGHRIKAQITVEGTTGAVMLPIDDAELGFKLILEKIKSILDRKYWIGYTVSLCGEL